MRVDSILDRIKKPIYLITVGSLYILYFVALIGLFYIKPSYIKLISNIAHTFICLFLIIRFNPLRKHVYLNEFDDKIRVIYPKLFILCYKYYNLLGFDIEIANEIKLIS
jgi:hypothetical protein